jgi:hypothetical protein
MHRRVLAVVLGAALGVPVVAQGQANAPVAVPHVRRTPAIAALNGFVANHGQWADEVLYFARHRGIEATLLADALVLRPMPDLERPDAPRPEPLVLRFPAASAIVGEGLVPTRHHFLLGTGSASDVPGFVQVLYRDVVPGIDLLVRKDALGFAYDLHVAAGADLASLVLDIEGAEEVSLRAADVLAMETATAGIVEQRIGAAWQVDAATGERQDVASSFLLLDPVEGRRRFGFEAAERDPETAFVLDPSLVWSTYVGGSSQELVKDVEVTPDGAVYLAVKSTSTGPTTPGSFQPVKAGVNDAWVGKLSPDGSALEWATFLGGSDTEDVVGVAVDPAGEVLVLGDTWSNDFPVTAGSFLPVFAGQNDMFLSRLTPDGSSLVWSTFYGGPENDHASAMALFPSGDVLVAGDFDVPGPPATPGAFDIVFDAGDYSLARFSADGRQLVFQTYFNGAINDVACDEELGIVLAGSADLGLPTTPGAFKETLAPGDSGDGFVAKMDSMGSQLLWATFLGGLGSDTIYGLAMDAAGAVYVAGSTLTDDFPVTPGAFDTTPSSDDPDNGYVAKLFPGGSGLVWASYLSACCGGSTLQWDIAVDTAGNAISVGSSNEPNFPTTGDALQPTYIGGFPSSDAHMTKFDAFGETLVYSSYFGGTSSDYLPLVALDAAQDPVIALRSSSSNLPITNGAYDTTFAGSTDTVVAKFDLELLPWLVLGGGLAGSVDTPNLAGGGALTPGSPGRLSVRGAAALAPASLVAGLSEANLTFKGGTIVPFPAVILTLATDGQGALDLPFTWINVPAGIAIWVQVWIKDTGAPTGYSATNALRMTSQ